MPLSISSFLQFIFRALKNAPQRERKVRFAPSSFVFLRRIWHLTLQNNAGCRVSQGPVPQPLLISPLFTSCCILAGKWMSGNKKSADSGNSHKLHRTLPQNSGKTRQFYIISFLLCLRFSLPETLPLPPDHLNQRHQSDR